MKKLVLGLMATGMMSAVSVSATNSVNMDRDALVIESGYGQNTLGHPIGVNPYHKHNRSSKKSAQTNKQNAKNGKKSAQNCNRHSKCNKKSHNKNARCNKNVEWDNGHNYDSNVEW